MYHSIRDVPDLVVKNNDKFNSKNLIITFLNSNFHEIPINLIIDNMTILLLG